ncbi:MAG: response regulator transcription factor [Spirochaetaceae bacterium]|nr:response regulator transcription factor [Spirochaetaceae bacterium]MBQ4554549.1 response regulator transcription factor [Spirochaetaceae bacterium]MBQ4555354.1 response regulator transcription factor [Spirochaetaceae bacterium]
MVKILVVEDDKNLNKSICLFLAQKGFEAQGCYDGEEALDVLYKTSFDLVISDIMMPKVDGYKLLENVRKLDKSIPFIFMTAKEDFPSKQKGFNAGVDDYLVKPVDLQELYLRVNALLRRANINVEKKLVVGNFTMDVEEHMAYIGDEEVNFTTREFDIVFKFLSYPKKTFSRSQLMNEFWNPDSFTGTRTVDVYITKIREKLANCKDFEIVTVHGLGYKAVIAEKDEKSL